MTTFSLFCTMGVLILLSAIGIVFTALLDLYNNAESPMHKNIVRDPIRMKFQSTMDQFLVI